MRKFRSLFVSFTFILMLMSFVCISPSMAQRPVVDCQWATVPPTTDGQFATGEYPEPPQISMIPDAFPIEAYVYFMNDHQYLYVLIDAVGDTTDTQGGGGGVFSYDECLLVFDYVNRIVAEIWGVNNQLAGSDLPAGSTAAIGFGTSINDGSTNHRIFEFKIPLAGINGAPGASLDFASPYSQKFDGGSMPYDSETYRDNIWPDGLDENNENTWATIRFAEIPMPVPTLGQWGVIVLSILMAGPALLAIRKRRKS
ncbi:MAG: IPTL-CTERM sorting domain-containing protein [Deltaproteobacteria bacterium]|nr:IPTL-CTERM sorting domain-containing protein [Deltaproteobacteria bacterium]MBW2283186.1 IPTL-CTERM sorting domain-containing protein [Deltaproteobacteria bacterium]